MVKGSGFRALILSLNSCIMLGKLVTSPGSMNTSLKGTNKKYEGLNECAQHSACHTVNAYMHYHPAGPHHDLVKFLRFTKKLRYKETSHQATELDPGARILDISDSIFLPGLNS